MNYNKNKYIEYILLILMIFYGSQYLFQPTKYSVIVDFILFLVAFIYYLWVYRRENFFCFEFLLILFGSIGMFFTPLILPLIASDFEFHTINNIFYELKSYHTQMLAYIMLLYGCCHANKKMAIHVDSQISISQNQNVNWDMFLKLLTVILLLLIIYDYTSGIFNSWFYYSNFDVMDVEDRNEGLGHLTCLLVAASMIEIVRLHGLRVSTIFKAIKKCNKLFVIEWIFISGLLLVSGNRNEMLLVLLPFVIAFSMCIHKISNRIWAIAIIIGALVMYLVGATRHDKVSLINNNKMEVSNMFVDYAPMAFDCDYLIQYTDKNGCTYFSDVPTIILSGIPVIGPKLIDAIGIKGGVASSKITTEGAGTISGMGTSLVGDLYYSGGILWVLLYMYFIGYIMSKLYYSTQFNSIYALTFYTYMVGNAVYYARSSWTFPFTIIEYVCVILLIGSIFFKKVKN